MKILHLTQLSLLAFLFFNCSPVEDKEQVSYIPDDDCKKECNIIHFPNDTNSSTSNCGQITFEIIDDYYRICLEADLQILEFVGWSVVGEADYYNQYWSFAQRDNCFIFQTQDDLTEEILENGFRLDVIICETIYDLETTTT